MFQTGVIVPKFLKLKSSETVKAFDCGDADLNDFILNQSAPFAKSLLATSYVCVNPQDASDVYAFCSLTNDKVAITDFPGRTEFNLFRKNQGFPQAKRFKCYPAVKICRLGVDVSARKKHVGSMVVDYIKSLFSMDNKTGCRFLTVDAYLAAIPFYQKNGFDFLNHVDECNPHTRLMYFDLMDIK